MSGLDRESQVFEERARIALERGVAGTPAHVRSRLNRARQAAIDEATARANVSAWRSWAPAGAVAATVLVAVVSWQQLRPGSGAGAPAAETPSTVEVLDLVADNEALELAGGTADYAFYEWAAAEQGGGET
jgi:hypothetical protein